MDRAAVALMMGELGVVEGGCNELSNHCRTLGKKNEPRQEKTPGIHLPLNVGCLTRDPCKYVYIYMYII